MNKAIQAKLFVSVNIVISSQVNNSVGFLFNFVAKFVC